MIKPNTHQIEAQENAGDDAPTSEDWNAFYAEEPTNEGWSMFAEDGQPIEDDDLDGDNGWSDGDYDSHTLASAGWGTDEDYGLYDYDDGGMIGGDSDLMGEW